MDEEKNQNRGGKDRKAVDAEGQPQKFLKEDTGNAGTYDKAQIKTKIGQRICLFPLCGGGIVCVEGIIGW